MPLRWFFFITLSLSHPFLSCRRALFVHQGLFEKLRSVFETHGSELSPKALGVNLSIVLACFPSLDDEQKQVLARTILPTMHSTVDQCKGDQGLSCIILNMMRCIMELPPDTVPDVGAHMEAMVPFLQLHLLSAPGSRTLPAACALVDTLCTHPVLSHNDALTMTLTKAVAAALGKKHANPTQLLSAAKHCALRWQPTPSSTPPHVLSLLSTVQGFVKHNNPDVQLAAVDW